MDKVEFCKAFRQAVSEDFSYIPKEDKINCEFSDDFDSRMQELFKKIESNITFPEKAVEKHGQLKIKMLIIAACVAVILLILNIVAIANGDSTIELLKSFGDRIVGMAVGEQVDYKGVTIRKIGNSENYDTVEEFVKAYKLTVLYPTKLPEGDSIKYVDVADYITPEGETDSRYKEVTFITELAETSIFIKTHPDAVKRFLSNEWHEKKIINNLECYIFGEPLFYQCNFVYNNCLYTVNSPSEKDTIMIIENLKKVE